MTVTVQDRRELMRLLHGELAAGPAERLEARLCDEASLAGEYARMGTVWQGLEEAPPTPASADLAIRILERHEVETSGPVMLRWSGAPVWVRTAAAVALTLGIVSGVVAGRQAASDNWEEYPGAQPTLAETFWQNLGDANGELDVDAPADEADH